MVTSSFPGKLEDGTVFDSNVENSRKKDRKALKFKVGTGTTISYFEIIVGQLHFHCVVRGGNETS